MGVVLTVAEIIDLAIFAGIDVCRDNLPDEDEMGEMIKITEAHPGTAWMKIQERESRQDTLHSMMSVPRKVVSHWDQNWRVMMNKELTRYSQDMDGYMDADPEGNWVRFEDVSDQSEVVIPEDIIDAIDLALRKAWQLGQTYWSQADSESMKQWKKAEETQAKFTQLQDEIQELLRGKNA